MAFHTEFTNLVPEVKHAFRTPWFVLHNYRFSVRDFAVRVKLEVVSAFVVPKDSGDSLGCIEMMNLSVFQPV